MRPRTRWTIVAVVVFVALGAAVSRLVLERRAAGTTAPAAATARAPAALELTDGDIVSAARAPLQRTVDVSGSVRAVQSAFVKARVAGEIVRIRVREGEAVRAGQVLVEQDTTELDLRLRQAEQQTASARAQLEIAQRTLANNRALVAQGFISATALEASVSNEAAAQAALMVAQAAVDLARKARADALLASPIGGLVAQRLAQPGERVSVDARILEVVDLSRLEVEAALPAEDVVALRVGQPAALRVDGIDAEIPARVARINPSAQAGARTVAVYLTIDGQPGLRQGLFARGRVVLEERLALVLPPSAVRTDRALPYVLALQGDRIVAQTVRTGTRGRAAGQEALEIAEGLAEGTRVLAGSVGAAADGTAWRLSAVRGPGSAAPSPVGAPVPASAPAPAPR
jgi:membrane fusion protein (multidrug efflux system)